MDAPGDTYYRNVDSRVPGHGLDLDAMKARGQVPMGDLSNALMF